MANKAMLKYIENDVDMIQGWMDNNIEMGKAMTGGTIYEGVKDNLTRELNKNTFSSSLSTTISFGIITGYEGRKRLGYIHKDDPAFGPAPDVKPSKGEEYNFSIQLTRIYRIAQTDKHNYSRQKLSGNQWHSETYHNNLGDCLIANSKFLLSKKLQGETHKELREVAGVVRQAETAILGHLMELAGDQPLEKQSSVEAEEKSA